MTKPHKSKAMDWLQDSLDQIDHLKNSSNSSPEFKKWQRDTTTAIANVFGGNSKHVGEFEQIYFFSLIVSSSMPGSRDQQAFLDGLSDASAMLSSMVGEVDKYWDDFPVPTSNVTPNGQVTTRDVFVVHGRDEGAKETAARFLRQLELNPIVLHEQPNDGRTIIEKFEDYAQVGFAVALLTPDDKCIVGDNEGKTRFRARQNVIFELGYFIGKLGRSKTCALFKGDLDMPSDYDGVLYIEMDDDGAWKQHLVREMKSAGIEIDANRMF